MLIESSNLGALEPRRDDMNPTLHATPNGVRIPGSGARSISMPSLTGFGKRRSTDTLGVPHVDSIITLKLRRSDMNPTTRVTPADFDI